MPLTARRHIRKMRGGAQAHLVEADDGAFYVVKFQDNPQHRRILVNELVSSILLQYLQLATPETAVIHITEEFLREYPEASIDLGTRRQAHQPGWQFGSKYPGDPARLAVYDFLPDALLDQVTNYTDFLGALVFDKWVANSDARQAVFFRARVREWLPRETAAPLKMGFVAYLIDNGYAFNGPYWDFPESPVQGLYTRKRVYGRVASLDDFQPWLDRVVHFPEDTIDQAVKQIPPEWIAGDRDAFDRMMERLMRKRKGVPALISDVRRAKSEPFPNWK
jgi:hypothetical protein